MWIFAVGMSERRFVDSLRPGAPWISRLSAGEGRLKVSRCSVQGSAWVTILRRGRTKRLCFTGRGRWIILVWPKAGMCRRLTLRWKGGFQ
jgi:hypothetical protein